MNLEYHHRFHVRFRPCNVWLFPVKERFFFVQLAIFGLEGTRHAACFFQSCEASLDEK